MSNGEFGENVNNFTVDKSSSAHVDIRKKYILVLRKGARDESDDTKITSVTKYSINITRSRNKFYLSLHYNEKNFGF